MNPIIRLRKSFGRNADIHPHHAPVLPTPEELLALGHDNAMKRFDQYEEDFHGYLKDNSAAFENALMRMKICAFLKGFFNPFGKVDLSEHCSWCPFDEWYGRARMFDSPHTDKE